jgi:hypothetical protein
MEQQKAEQKAETQLRVLSADERRTLMLSRWKRKNEEWLKKNGLKHDGKER